MNEWWLVLFLVCLTVAMGGFIVYPLRHSKWVWIGVFPCLLGVASLGYYYWGGFTPWHAFLVEQRKEAHAKQILQAFKSSKDLIANLKSKLDQTPASARGWYLLGRLYLHEQMAKEATEAFSKAYTLQPNNTQFALQYAYNAWLHNDQKASKQVQKILQTILAKNPEQVDALALLAKDAFVKKHYKVALNYWQRLLPLLPRDSKEAQVIREAIMDVQLKNSS